MLNQIYRLLSLYTNYFQPLRKLIAKERVGAKAKKKYDVPKTPYHRVVDISETPERTKGALTSIYNQLNPAQLKREYRETSEKKKRKCKTRRISFIISELLT